MASQEAEFNEYKAFIAQQEDTLLRTRLPMKNIIVEDDQSYDISNDLSNSDHLSLTLMMKYFFLPKQMSTVTKNRMMKLRTQQLQHNINKNGKFSAHGVFMFTKHIRNSKSKQNRYFFV